MSRMNSVSDLIPLCAKAMEDKQWHGMAYFLKEVGESISFERAVRFYEGMGGGAAAAGKEGGDQRPLDERTSSGRRRGIYLALSSLTDRGDAECKDKAAKVDDREYRMLKPLSEKPTKQPPTKQPAPAKKPVQTAKTKDAQALVEFLGDLETASNGVFKITQDREDWNMHLRHMRRIALMYSDPAPVVPVPAPSAPPPEQKKE